VGGCKTCPICVQGKIVTSGDELKALRKSLKLTQAQLAKRLGVSRQTVSNTERGEASLVMSLIIEKFRASLLESGEPIKPVSEKPKRHKA
jgi:transcriptional regulator with XRE-family HTH domain